MGDLIGTTHKPLHLAAFFGISALVQKIWCQSLLSTSGSYNFHQTQGVAQRDSAGRTPLEYAAEHGFDDIVEALLDVLEYERDTHSAFLKSLQKGHVSIARSIWNSGMILDVNWFLTKCQATFAHSRGIIEIILFCIARSNSSQALLHGEIFNQELILSLIEKNWRSRNISPLLVVRNAQEGNELMLAINVEPSKSYDKETIYHPTHSAYMDEMQVLIQRSPTHLHEIIASRDRAPVIQKGPMKLIRLLLNERKESNSFSQPTISPISLAIRYGNERLLWSLVKCGVSVNPTVYETEASYGCDYSVTDLPGGSSLHNYDYYFTDGGDNPLTKHGVRRKPLSLAVGQGNLTMVRLLLENRAEVNSKSFPWRQPLSLAIRTRREDIVLLLLQHGANPNPPKGPGSEDLRKNMMPLSLAVQLGSVSIAKILLEHGADTNFQESLNYFPPLYTTIERMNRSMAQLLKYYGAQFKGIPFLFEMPGYAGTLSVASGILPIEWDWRDNKEVVKLKDDTDKDFGKKSDLILTASPIMLPPQELDGTSVGYFNILIPTSLPDSPSLNEFHHQLERRKMRVLQRISSKLSGSSNTFTSLIS